MAVPDNGERRYRVKCSEVVAEGLRQFQRRASRHGRGKALLRAFQQIVRRLEQDPFHVGEPVYRLPSLRLQIRTAIVRPLVVGFAVSEDRPLVFIKSVRLLSRPGK